MSPSKPGKKTKHTGVRRLPGTGPKGLPLWKARRVFTDPKTGRRVNRTQVLEGTIDDAVKARAELSLEKSAPPLRRVRLREYAETVTDENGEPVKLGWVAKREIKRKLKGSTVERYEDAVGHFLVEWGDWYLDAIDHAAVDEWLVDVAQLYEPSTVNGWLRILRNLFTDAMNEGLVTENPARTVSAVRERKTKGPRGRALRASEMLVLLQKLPESGLDLQMQRLLIVAAWTGLRLGELVPLTWDQIVDGEIYVDRGLWRNVLDSNKTDDPRCVPVFTADLLAGDAPLDDDIVRILPSTALADQRRYLMESQHPGLESGLVFPAALQQAKAGHTRRLKKAHERDPEAELDFSWYRSQSSIQGALTKACAAAGVPRVTPHSMRRTFEDLLREVGVEKLVRQAILGWRTDTAQGIYATVSRIDRDRAVGSVGRLVLESSR